MFSIESDETTQSSDDVCCGVLHLVLITTIVLCTVQAKSLFANSTQTNIRAESNEFLTELSHQIQYTQDKTTAIIPTRNCLKFHYNKIISHHHHHHYYLQILANFWELLDRDFLQQ